MVLYLLILFFSICIAFYLILNKRDADNMQLFRSKNPPPEECEPNQYQDLCCTLYNYDPINQANINTQQAVYCENKKSFVSTTSTGCFNQNPLCPIVSLNSQNCPLYTPTSEDSCFIYTIMVDNTNEVNKFYITYLSDQESSVSLNAPSAGSIILSKNRSTIFNFSAGLFTTINNSTFYIMINNEGQISIEPGIISQKFFYNCGILYNSLNQMISISNQISDDNTINLMGKTYDPNNLNNSFMFYFEMA